MILATMKNNSAFLLQEVYSTPEKIDCQKLALCFHRLLNAHSILRTSFVSTSEGVYQVLYNKVEISDCIIKRYMEPLHKVLESDRSRGFNLHMPYWIRLSVVSESKIHHLILTMHHSLYDGWSYPIIIGDLIGSYRMNSTIDKSPEFRLVTDFIYGQDPDSLRQFWSEYLKEFIFDFKLPKGLSKRNHSRKILDFSLTSNMSEVNKTTSSLKITMATLLKTAWALTLKKYLLSNDIIFGIVVNGREMPISQVER
jgi:hypothetical protein